MKLYDLKAGTNTRRVRIFLAEKGVKMPTVEVGMMKGENKSRNAAAAVDPHGLVALARALISHASGAPGRGRDLPVLVSACRR